jgi:hypothetical protein
MCNELSSSKRITTKRQWCAHCQKAAESADNWYSSMQKKRPVQTVSRGYRKRAGGLGDGEQIESKRTGECGGETMECDDKPGSIGGPGIARQSLLPGQTPMRALGPGQDGFSGPYDG